MDNCNLARSNEVDLVVRARLWDMEINGRIWIDYSWSGVVEKAEFRFAVMCFIYRSRRVKCTVRTLDRRHARYTVLGPRALYYADTTRLQQCAHCVPGETNNRCRGRLQELPCCEVHVLIVNITSIIIVLNKLIDQSFYDQLPSRWTC